MRLRASAAAAAAAWKGRGSTGATRRTGRALAMSRTKVRASAWSSMVVKGAGQKPRCWHARCGPCMPAQARPAAYGVGRGPWAWQVPAVARSITTQPAWSVGGLCMAPARGPSSPRHAAPWLPCRAGYPGAQQGAQQQPAAFSPGERPTGRGGGAGCVLGGSCSAARMNPAGRRVAVGTLQAECAAATRRQAGITQYVGGGQHGYRSGSGYLARDFKVEAVLPGSTCLQCFAGGSLVLRRETVI